MKTNKLLTVFFSVCLFLSYLGIGQNAQSLEKRSISKNKGNINLKILPTALQEAYDVKWCFLDLNVENNTTAFFGNTTIKAQVVWPVMDTFSFHLHNKCVIDSIYVNGEKKDFVSREDERLIPGLAFNQGYLFDVQVFYHRSTDPDVEGIYTAKSSSGFSVTWTHTEPNLAYHWFPVKQNLNDKIDSVWIFVTTSGINKVASNGLLTHIASLPENKIRYEWKSNYPICYYLISIAVADYQDYSFYAVIPETQDSILIQNYIYNSPNYLAAIKEDIDKTKDMMILFSGLFGDYPFKKEKYGHAVAPFPIAMEHQTMTTIGSFIDKTVAHELAHQWFGNNVTCGLWEHVWLNEGFASYSEFFWDEHFYGKSNAREIFVLNHINYVLEYAQTGSVYVPKDSIDNKDRIFNYALSYSKGACLLHMLRFELNDDSVFFNTLKTYQQRLAGKTAVTNDFKEIAEELSGKDFTTFFNQWFYGEGYPIFNLTWEQVNEQLRIQSEQTTTTSVTPLYKTSFEIKIKYSNGTDEIIRLFQEESNQRFTYIIPSGVDINSIEFDPLHWLLAKHTIHEGSVSIQENSIAQNFSLYPNPANNCVNISFNEPLQGEKGIELVNVEGKIIKKISTNEKNYLLDISLLNSGIYYLLVHFNGEVGLKKIVKQ